MLYLTLLLSIPELHCGQVISSKVRDIDQLFFPGTNPSSLSLVEEVAPVLSLDRLKNFYLQS